MTICEHWLSAIAATASLERTFSSFGMTQSKLCNRLGNEKAGKLAFLFKYKNQMQKNVENPYWILDNSNIPRPLPEPSSEHSIDSDKSDDNLPIIMFI